MADTESDREVSLNETEREAVRSFIYQLSLENAFGDGILVSEKEAIQFLMARKFDVGRAISLFHTNRMLRGRFELEDLNPNVEPLSSELRSGKFTILSGKGENGATVCLFYAKKHFPRLVDHITVMKSLVYQLDYVMKCTDAQRQGLSLIYDMAFSGYQNFDFDLAMKVLHLLKGGYPARLKHVYIVSSPLWFRASLAVLSSFLKDKIRDRVEVVKNNTELLKYLSKESLPVELGGLVHHDHAGWIQQCIISSQRTHKSNEANHTEGPHNSNKYNNESPHTTTPEADNRVIFEDMSNHELLPNGDIKRPSLSSLVDTESSEPVKQNTSPLKPPRKPLPAPPGEIIESDEIKVPSLPNESNNEDVDFTNDIEEEVQLTDDRSRSIDQLMQYMSKVGRKGVHREYEELRSLPPTGTFESTLYTVNLRKNRYNNILSFEETRVKLQTINNDPFSDYINANYVNGYDQEKKFICTQGPTPQTFFDFWRMIWEQKVVVVVMVTRCQERGRTKCGQYWPKYEDETVTYGHLTVTNIASDVQQHFTSTLLELHNNSLQITRRVCHIQFTSWPDFGVLPSAVPILDAIDLIEQYQQEGIVQIQNELQHNAPNMEGSGEYMNLTDDAQDTAYHENTVEEECITQSVAGDSDVNKNINDGEEPSSVAATSSPPPVVVHCSAGVGRTGTFCCLNNSVDRLKAIGTVDIFNAVKEIRDQRAFSVQTPDQYQFCYTGVIESVIRDRRADGMDTSDLERCIREFVRSDLSSDSD